MGASATKSTALAALLAAALLLAACGGGGGGNPPNPAPALRSGELDASYGAGGHVLLPGSEGLSDMVVAPDGSVFLTGAAIVKLDSRGALDTSYGAGGRVALRSASPVLDEAGNLYLAGSRSGVAYSTEVVNFDRDGRRVQGYGSGGAFNVVSTRPTRVATMALDSEGNVYVGGYDFIPFVGARNSRLMIVKGDGNGRIASDFGVAGVWLEGSCETFRGVLSIAIDAAGHVVIGGECHPFTLDLSLATVRKLDGRGNPVPFQDPGYELFGVSVPPGPVIEAREARAVLVRPDRSIYAAGTRLSGASCSEPAVAKLAADGTLVTDFGAGAKVAFNTTGVVGNIGMDDEGRLYVGIGTPWGCPGSATAPDFVVYRLGG